MTKAACSIIISTYNWPAALRLCFQSVLKQSVLPSEIIVADDGSNEETRELIEHFKRYSVVPVIHVWQPDEGFQLAKIRNKAIAKTTQPYIVQVDGDLILHPHFLEDHLHLRENGYFISGSRVLLSAETSQALLTNQSINVHRHYLSNRNFFNRFRNKLLRNILSTRYKVRGKHTYYVKGCNMSFWRRDLLKVNGYNEDFTGWGREDSELAIRLINTGVKKKFLKMGGVTYHIHHKEASRDLESQNTSMVEHTIREKKVFAENGLNQYL